MFEKGLVAAVVENNKDSCQKSRCYNSTGEGQKIGDIEAEVSKKPKGKKRHKRVEKLNDTMLCIGAGKCGNLLF
ncbi:hypothetical protein AAHB36_19730 [Bacillus velezensis]